MLGAWIGRIVKTYDYINRVVITLLGNVVISKKFLCTRKIMVMHSKNRGECDLRTLVDRKRKR